MYIWFYQWLTATDSHVYIQYFGVKKLDLHIVGARLRNLSLATFRLYWLRCCATNRKVAGSIPDGVIRIFHGRNPSDHTMALGSTQPLTEMSTRRISWG